MASWWRPAFGGKREYRVRPFPRSVTVTNRGETLLRENCAPGGKLRLVRPSILAVTKNEL